MAGRGSQSFKKRQKEQQRKEKQQEKIAKRIARKFHARAESEVESPETGEVDPSEVEPTRKAVEGAV